MLRVALIVTPIALMTAMACGDSGGSDNSGNSGTAGSTNAAGASDTNQGGDNSSTGATSNGGSSSNGGTKSNGGTSSNGGTKNTGGTSTNPTGGASDMGGAGGSPDNAAGAGGAAAGNCLDVFGNYTIKTAVGMCGDLDKIAPQSIQGNDIKCAAHFVSAPPGKAKPGLNGAAKINALGGFTGAKLSLGTGPATNCTGTYNAVSTTMTVQCGTVKDGCTVMLQKQ